MKGLVGAIALLAIASVMVIQVHSHHSSTPSVIAQLGKPEGFRSLVIRKSPALFRRWEADLQGQMLTRAQ
jgi:hypothetical protein